MYNIPKLRVNGGITFNYAKFMIFAGCNFGSKSKSNNRYTIEGTRHVEIDSYILSNFSISYLPIPKISIKLSANNFGKLKYSDPDESSNIHKLGNAGMAQPTNTVMLKVAYRF